MSSPPAILERSMSERLTELGARREEALASSDRFLQAAATKRVVLKEFRDSFFPYIGGEIK